MQSDTELTRAQIQNDPAWSNELKSLRERHVAIIGGCGHVGLPLGIAFATHGFRVHLIDSFDERVESVNRGEMPFQESGAQALLPDLVQSGKLRATTMHDSVREAGAVIVTIGTPVGEHLDPVVAVLDAAMNTVAEFLSAGQLLVLRSTVFPGVTKRLARQLKQRGLGGVDLAYCPERILQDQALYELEHLPQLVAGANAQAARRAAALFSFVCPKILFLEPIEAELAKLFCNAYRYINFAISNQFYVMAQQFGADFERIFHAMRDDYPRMRSFARAGFAAGPCLVKDTMQLGAFNHSAFLLGQAAMMINEGLPYFLMREINDRFDLGNMVVGVLGMAFKPNNDDIRDSLSYKLRKVLALECRDVLCTDPYVKDASLVPLDIVLEKADLLVVGTPHDCYRTLVFRQPVIDVTGVIGSSRDLITPVRGPSGLRNRRDNVEY